MTVEWLTEQLKEHNIELTEIQKQQFRTCYRLLVEWNERMNLTNTTDEHGVYLRHFYDSIAPSFYFDFNQPMSICDVGAGTGSPGIPLKIIFPQLKVAIVDLLSKRIQPLDYLTSELQLQDVSFIHDRAETFGEGVYRESCDVVTARTVTRLSMLSELCLSLVKKGGRFVALKSSKDEEELEEAKFAISVLGGNVTKTHTFGLPEDTGERQMFIIGKKRQTPKEYPRKSGAPNKTPLLEK